MEFENGMKMCDKEKEKNSDWKSVMQQLDDYVSATTKLTFASYYITPIQRVPRYVILIRDLIKSTNERHAGMIVRSHSRSSSICPVRILSIAISLPACDSLTARSR